MNIANGFLRAFAVCFASFFSGVFAIVISMAMRGTAGVGRSLSLGGGVVNGLGGASDGRVGVA